MLSATDGWAVGQGGTIMHWDGSAWTLMPSPAREALYAVDAVSAADAWAVGDGEVILHWDGGSWSQIAVPNAGSSAFYSVSAISPTQVWVAGYWCWLDPWSDGVLKPHQYGWQRLDRSTAKQLAKLAELGRALDMLSAERSIHGAVVTGSCYLRSCTGTARWMRCCKGSMICAVVVAGADVWAVGDGRIMHGMAASGST
jgi:hypothetical protein